MPPNESPGSASGQNKGNRERQATWIGHVLRGDTLVKDILEGRIGLTGKSKVEDLDAEH